MVEYSKYENGGCYGSLCSREKGEDESRERESVLSDYEGGWLLKP